MELVVLGLILLGAGLVGGGWITRRTRVESMGYWPWAWAAILGGAAALTLSDRVPGFLYAAFVLGSLFPALLLAGALRRAERAVPGWLIPAGLAIGGGRAVLYALGLETASYGLALAFEPLTVLAAAVVVQRAASECGSRVGRLIAVWLLLIAGLEATDAYGSMRGGADSVPWLPWIVLGVPLAIIQAFASLNQIRAGVEDSRKALEESVSLLQATLDSTADGLLLVDRHGRFANFNQRFAEMWGLPQEILDESDETGAIALATQQMKNPAVFADTVKRLYSEPKEESFDTLELKDGRIIETYSQPRRIGQEIAGRVWSFRDVTARRHAEEVLAGHRHQLEELVQERTRELLESRNKLRQADRLASVGTLAAGIAHQINNPIGAILNASEYALLCEDEEDVKTVWKGVLESSQREARRCGEIVRSMLQFARDERTEKWVEDLNHVVRSAFGVTSAYARERSARIEIELAEAPLPVFMSPIEVEQVLVNVIRNGLESRDSDAHVKILTERRDSRAHVRVHDNGKGLTPEIEDRIFDPFFSTRLQQGGTGLGLSVAHGIVGDHDGEIWIDHEPTGGTSIVMELPLAEEAAGKIDPPAC